MNSLFKPHTKNIIFDLGGVIINILPENIIQEMPVKRADNFRKAFTTLSEKNVFDDFEIGKISPEIFRQTVCSEIQENLSDTEFDRLWNKLLLDYPEENIAILRALAKKYRLFLLSNTNIIHYQAYSPQLKNQFGLSFSDLFEKTWLSYEIGLRKPEAKIFQYALQNADIKAEETVFIDDMPENIRAAKELNIQTLQIERNAGLRSIFRSLIS